MSSIGSKALPAPSVRSTHLLFTTGEHACHSHSGTEFIEGDFESYSLVLTEEGTEIFIGLYRLDSEYLKSSELFE